MTEAKVVECMLANSKFTRKQILGMLNGCNVFQKDPRTNKWSVAVIDEVE